MLGRYRAAHFPRQFINDELDLGNGVVAPAWLLHHDVQIAVAEMAVHEDRRLRPASAQALVATLRGIARLRHREADIERDAARYQARIFGWRIANRPERRGVRLRLRDRRIGDDAGVEHVGEELLESRRLPLRIRAATLEQYVVRVIARERHSQLGQTL